MPRAPATPPASDALNLSGLSDALSVATTAVLPANAALPYPFLHPPISHPILNIHISN
jgi:hypothetical protein